MNCTNCDRPLATEEEAARDDMDNDEANQFCWRSYNADVCYGERVYVDVHRDDLARLRAKAALADSAASILREHAKEEGFMDCDTQDWFTRYENTVA